MTKRPSTDEHQLTQWKRRNFRILTLGCGLVWIVLALMAYELGKHAEQPSFTHLLAAVLKPAPIVAVIAFFGWLRVVGAEKGWGFGLRLGRRKDRSDQDHQE